jgi:hypothetical protein
MSLRMISEVISEIINKEVVSIYKTPSDKDMLIYLNETNELFSTTRYDGYLRNTKMTFVTDEKMPNYSYIKASYKLVLFLPLTTCDSTIMNIVANLKLDIDNNGIKKIEPKDIYTDSWDNIKKELGKDKVYLKYRVVAIDLDTEEKICNKIKLKCNG